VIFHVVPESGGEVDCLLGAVLARREIGVLLEEIARRQVRFELTESPVRGRSQLVWGFASIARRAVSRR